MKDKCIMCNTTNTDGCYSIQGQTVCKDCGKKYSLEEIKKMITKMNSKPINEERLGNNTFTDEDEAEYYRNKELYAHSGLARHRQAMEKAKEACKEKGIDGKECLIITNIGVQSPDIAQGVTQCNGTIGAGDQGMMYGYACDDTEELMPLSISLAHKLSKRLTQVRKEGILPYLYPDGKSQVTVAYNNQGEILGVTDVVISAQHNAEVSVQKLRMDIEEHVIREVIPKELLLPDVKIHINPTGRFVVGGPAGDVGLTGRKIIVDTYGGIARHGGGAFSGKDPTKVDRSAAYMARYAAKNVVAAGFCKKCEINLAYAIGIPQPVSIKIDTFGTEEIPKEIIEDTVNEVFDFSVAGIINSLSLTKVKYKPVAAYGHFGRTDLDLPWERLDKVNILQEKAVARVAEEIYKNR